MIVPVGGGGPRRLMFLFDEHLFACVAVDGHYVADNEGGARQ